MKFGLENWMDGTIDGGDHDTLQVVGVEGYISTPIISSTLTLSLIQLLTYLRYA
jgi:hypothetical protein